MSLEPQPDPIFFLDRTVAMPRVQAALREQQTAFVSHADLFRPEAPDTEWLPAVVARDLCVLTQERRIRYNPLEQQALLASGGATFIIVAKGLTSADLAACVVRALPRLRRFALRTPRPFLAKVYVDGSVQLLSSPS
ncbi:hypothetical protein [Hymenobacter sp. UYP22]|uniref:PIN-like domain-containing protein n=1 Tax=Hymenobacter sp. UYP22 TaxID=3156348 RepID=UPI003399BD74